MTSAARGAFIAAVLAVPLAAQQPTQQSQPARQTQPAQQRPPATFRAGTDLVEVDVVVHGRDGAFVSDLSANDFVIEESSQPQEIQQFYLRLTNTASLPHGAGPRVLGSTPAASATGSRVFVVVFDDEHLTPAGFKRTQAAALTLFSQQFRTGDVGGVVARGRMVKDRLTTDREELLKAIKDAKPSAARNTTVFAERQWPRLSEVEAVRIVFNADQNVLRAATQRACDDDPLLCAKIDPEPAVRSKASQLASDVRTESARTMQALRTLAEGLGKMDGRKTILLMSEGFMAEDTWPLVQDTVALAARANARIYTLDARGLDRNANLIFDVDPNGDDKAARILQQMEFGADSMNSLAVDTGGFVVRNTNQFDKAVARIGDDVNNYYVLGYRPTTPADGKFHRISVKVKRADVAVRARRGYVATPRPAAVTTVAAPTPAVETAAAAETTAAAATAEPSPAPAAAAAPIESIPEHTPVEAIVVPHTENTSGIRLRPDANAHATALARFVARGLQPSEDARRLQPSDADARSAQPGGLDADATAGWDAYQRGDVETARARLTLAASRPTANAWVHYTLGMATYALRDYREASDAWERVRAEVPDFEPVYLDLVDAYLQMKEHDRAIRTARVAMERWPRDPEIPNALGVVQTVRGSLDDAIKSFQSAIAIAPNDATGHFNLAKAFELRYARSRHYVRQLREWVSNENDRKAAIDSYQRYLDLGGAYADAARKGLERLQWVPTPK